MKLNYDALSLLDREGWYTHPLDNFLHSRQALLPVFPPWHIRTPNIDSALLLLLPPTLNKNSKTFPQVWFIQVNDYLITKDQPGSLSQNHCDQDHCGYPHVLADHFKASLVGGSKNLIHTLVSGLMGLSWCCLTFCSQFFSESFLSRYKWWCDAFLKLEVRLLSHWEKRDVWDNTSSVLCQEKPGRGSQHEQLLCFGRHFLLLMGFDFKH